MCTHSVEFDSLYRAGIYGRPCKVNWLLSSCMRMGHSTSKFTAPNSSDFLSQNSLTWCKIIQASPSSLRQLIISGWPSFDWVSEKIAKSSDLTTKPFFGTATIRELLLLDCSSMAALPLFESCYNSQDCHYPSLYGNLFFYSSSFPKNRKISYLYPIISFWHLLSKTWSITCSTINIWISLRNVILMDFRA